jgi:hypothetical protein
VIGAKLYVPAYDPVIEVTTGGLFQQTAVSHDPMRLIPDV